MPYRLLANALFRGQRGWVKLDNKRFQSKIGATVSSYVFCPLASRGFLISSVAGQTSSTRSGSDADKKKILCASVRCREATKPARPMSSKWTDICCAPGLRCLRGCWLSSSEMVSRRRSWTLTVAWQVCRQLRRAPFSCMDSLKCWRASLNSNVTRDVSELSCQN